MFRKKHLVSFILMALLGISSMAFSAEILDVIRNNTALFVRGGYCFPTEGYLEGGPVISAGGSHALSDRLRVELDARFSWLDSLNDSEAGTDSLGSGDLSLLGINISLCYSPVQSSNMNLYILGGAGYSFNSFSPVQGYSDLGFEIDESIDNSLSLHAGLGFDLIISGSFAINLDARFTFSQADGEWSIRDLISDVEASGTTDNLLHNVTVLLGLKYYIVL